MYFSRLELDLHLLPMQQKKELVQKGIYAIHQWVWRFFAGDEKRKFLFSIRARRDGFLVYILSENRPKEVSDFRLDIKEFNPKLKQGMPLAFELVVNPTICKQIKNKEHGMRCDIMMDVKFNHRELFGDALREEQKRAVLKWFKRKSLQSGFSFDERNIEFHNDGAQKIFSRNKRIIFGKASLKGILCVDDPGLFLKSMMSGYGAQKSFGCGLMLIRPVLPLE